MRYALIALSILFGSATTASAQVSIGISVPGVSIGINLPVYPELVPVPGYPVYYAPRVNSNFFFYDGLYWVYYGDNWYASSWYNGPWDYVGPEYVPVFVLRIPVRYYRAAPVYFHGWVSDAPPRWGQHWGHQWEQHRHGWDRWDRRATYTPAPLPSYQRQYSGDRYPRVEQQHALRNQNYRYQPRDAVVRQHEQERAVQRAPATSRPAAQGGPAVPRAQQSQRSTENVQREAQKAVPNQTSPQQRGPAEQSQRGRGDAQRAMPTQSTPQQRDPAVQEQRQPSRQETGPRAQQAPRAQGQERGAQVMGDTPQPKGNAERRQGRERGQERSQERSQEKER